MKRFAMWMVAAVLGLILVVLVLVNVRPASAPPAPSPAALRFYQAVSRTPGDDLGMAVADAALDPALTSADLIAALKHRDNEVRRAAALTLGFRRDTSATGALLDSARAGDENAAWALGVSGDPQAVQPLIDLLCGITAARRAATAPKTGPASMPKAVPIPRGFEVQLALAAALGDLHDPSAAQPLLDWLYSDPFPGIGNPRTTVTIALPELGAGAVPALLAALPKAGDEDQLTLITALGQIGDPRAAQPLFELERRNLSPRQRDAFLMALAHIGGKEVWTRLAPRGPWLKFNDSSNTPVFREAMLAQLPEARATVQAWVMRSDSRDSDYDRPGFTAEELAQMPDDTLAASARVEAGSSHYQAMAKIGAPAVPALLRQTRSAGAIWALGQIGDARAIAPLKVCAESPYSGIRGAALLALARLGERDFVIPHATRFLTDPEPADQQQRAAFLEGKPDAIRALAQAGDRGAIPMLLTLAVTITPAPEGGPTAGECAVRWLSQIAAIDALGTLKAPEAVDPLGNLLSHISPPSPPVLFDGPCDRLPDRSSSVREALTRALAELGDPRAVEPLLAAVASSDEDLSDWAILAIMRFKDPRIYDALALTLRRERSRWVAAPYLVSVDENPVLPLLKAHVDRLGPVEERAVAALGQSHSAPAASILESALRRILLAPQYGGFSPEPWEFLHWPPYDLTSVPGISSRPFLHEPMTHVLPLAYAQSAGRAATPLLRIVLRAPNWRFRIGAAYALGTLNDPAAIDDLAFALHDVYWPVRRAAVTALAGIPDPRVPALIRAAQNDSHPMVRRRAADLLAPTPAAGTSP